MFPDINIDNEFSLDNDDLTGKKTFLYDFTSGDFILKDGNLIVASELEAIELWIKKIILTEKFKFKIYEKDDDSEYGVSIKNIIGKRLPKYFVKSEIKRELTDAIIKHPKIDNLSDWRIEEEGSTVNISFKVNLVSSSTLEMEVNI